MLEKGPIEQQEAHPAPSEDTPRMHSPISKRTPYTIATKKPLENQLRIAKKARVENLLAIIQIFHLENLEVGGEGRGLGSLEEGLLTTD